MNNLNLTINLFLYDFLESSASQARSGELGGYLLFLRLCECLNIMYLSGQEMAQTGQRPLLKDSWRQNSILWEE